MNTKERELTKEAAMNLLATAAKQETQRGLAKRLGITDQYLCDVLHGRREGSKVLARFGFDRVVRYRRIPPTDGAPSTPPNQPALPPRSE